MLCPHEGFSTNQKWAFSTVAFGPRHWSRGRRTVQSAKPSLTAGVAAAEPLQDCLRHMCFAGALAAVLVGSAQLGRAKTAAMAEGENSMEPSETTIETMRKFSNQYARVTNTHYCTDKSVAAVVVVGLAHHKETLGAPLCPCRHYEDKEKEAKNGYWNCPCVPMRERHECHCMLFLTEDNPFASDCQNLDLEEILKLKST